MLYKVKVCLKYEKDIFVEADYPAEVLIKATGAFSEQKIDTMDDCEKSVTFEMKGEV